MNGKFSRPDKDAPKAPVKDIQLSPAELETLCHLYLEGRLSSLEEAQLRYVLLRSDADSPQIRKMRVLVAVEQEIGESTAARGGKPRVSIRRFALWSAAAILVGVVVLSVFRFCLGYTSAVETLPEGVQTVALPEKIADFSEDTVAPVDHPEAASRSPRPVPRAAVHPMATSSWRSEILSSKSRVEVEVESAAPTDGYVEVEDGSEASEILRDIDQRLTALVEKGIEAGNKVPEFLNDNLDNIYKIFNKI